MTDSALPESIVGILRNHLSGRPSEYFAAADTLEAFFQRRSAALLDACIALVAQLEYSMTGLVDARGQPFVPGESEVELRPDGSYRLSQARAAIAKATGAGT